MILLKINDQNAIKIAEYKEARKTIFALAEKYKDDITPVSRGGKNRAKQLFYNYPCSFDIETSTIRPGSYGYMHKDGRPLGVPYLFQWNIYGQVIICRYIEEAARIFEYLGEAFCRKNRRLIIFDHNLGYEYGFLNVTTVTGNNWYNEWKNKGYEGLLRKKGQGRKSKLPIIILPTFEG